MNFRFWKILYFLNPFYIGSFQKKGGKWISVVCDAVQVELNPGIA